MNLILTDDGSHTLYVPEIDEHYHSHFGAITESEHIFINAGLASAGKKTVSVLEVGFGTGLNALLTAQYACNNNMVISYHSIEKYPLEKSIVSHLNYGTLTGESGLQLFNKIHEAPWEVPVTINNHFILTKLKADLTADKLDGSFDLIYFDAFGPEKQPEMWSESVMSKVAAVAHSGTIFVTYSAKGSLKRMLKALGFVVTLLPGPPGKRVIIRAVKS